MKIKNWKINIKKKIYIIYILTYVLFLANIYDNDNFNKITI